jgi:hypothetical protein
MIPSLWTFRQILILPGPSDSDLQARETADNLQRHIEKEVEQDSDLSKRLESLQLLADAIEPENLGYRNAEAAESCQRLGSSDSKPGNAGPGHTA